MALGMDMATAILLLSVRMATMDTILTPVRPTDTTAHLGLAAASLSAPVRGSEAVMVMATAGCMAIAADSMDDLVMATAGPVTDMDGLATAAATVEPAQFAADSAAAFTATWVAADSMAEAVELTAAVDTDKVYVF